MDYLKNPMARYVPNHFEVEQLCELYAIGDLVNIDEELGGLFNVNLKITTTSGQYVIRIHPGLSSKNHLNAEKVILENLLEHGIPVLVPLYTKEGYYFSKLHNRFVQLTYFVQGDSFNFSIEQVYNMGKLLKRFHDALMDVKEVERLYFKVMEQWIGNDTYLTKSVIHGDWHPWNVLFNRNDEIKYILDFDFMQKGECIHDIAYFLWAIRNEENTEELGRHFLRGYGSLSIKEVELLPLAIARASLFFLCTSSFVANPTQELKKQIDEQKPYIEWLLSPDGKLRIKALAT